MAGKILAGLREALAYARGDCRHEFTYWAPGQARASNGRPLSWTRTCTKCKVTETSLLETPEIKAQT